MTQFYSKTKICYGAHAMETLERLPATKVFIVTDPFIANTGFVERLETHLSIGSIDFCVFADVEADPSLAPSPLRALNSPYLPSLPFLLLPYLFFLFTSFLVLLFLFDHYSSFSSSLLCYHPVF